MQFFNINDITFITDKSADCCIIHDSNSDGIHFLENSTFIKFILKKSILKIESATTFLTIKAKFNNEKLKLF